MRIDKATKRFLEENKGTLSTDMLVRKLIVLWCKDEDLRNQVKLSDYSSVTQVKDLQPYVEEQ